MELTKLRLWKPIAMAAAVLASGVAALTMMSSGIGSTASAAVVSGDYSYTINDDGTVTITDYSGSATALTIPSTIDSYAVSKIGDYAFDNIDSLSSVTIPSGVKSLGYRAFYDCNALVKVVIPGSVNTIGTDAFRYCGSLATVSMGHGVQLIDDGAFRYCGSLATISIPSTVVSIDPYAFDGCGTLAKVTFVADGDLGTIGAHAFDSCGNLASLSLPNSLVTIGDYAFSACKTLKTVTFSSEVLSIGTGAFNVCTNLSSIALPSGITNVKESLFNGCTNLTSVTIPNTVLTIENYAFKNCSNLASITVPNSVISMGKEVFYGCKNMTKAVLSSQMTALPYRTFRDCSSLTSVTLPQGLLKIEEQAFFGCSSLPSITLPADLTNINPCTFENCSALTGITIHSNIGSIGDYAFKNCSALKNVVIAENGVVLIGKEAFNNCDSLVTINIPDSVSTIGEYAFYDCDALKTVKLPSTLSVISKALFMNCDALTNITIPSTVTTISDNAFDICASLQTLTIPNTVTSIGSYAFASCPSLKNINFPTSMTYIPTGCFSDDISLQQVPLHADITAINYRAFQNCDSLATVVLPQGFTTLGEDAFRSCDSLQYIILPPSTTSVRWDSCYYDSNATVAYVPDTLATTISYVSNVFYNISNGAATITGLATDQEKLTLISELYDIPIKYVTAEHECTLVHTHYVVGGVCTLCEANIGAASITTKAYGGDGKVSLSWTSATNAAKYGIWISNGGSEYLMAETADTTYDVTDVVNGTRYGFRVAAYISGGWVSLDNYSIVYATPLEFSAPTISSISYGSNGVSLSWGAVNRATSYRVFRSTTSTGEGTQLAVQAGTSFTDTTAVKGTTYYYYVRAYNSNTKQLTGKSGVKYIKCVPLEAPEFTSLTSTTSSVVLKWNSISGATSYRLYRSTTNGGTKTRLITQAGTTYTDTAVTPGNTYYYYVQAYSNTTGLLSDYSAVRSKYVPKPSLAAPQFTSLSSDGTSVVLKWNSVSGATSYRVYRSTTNGGTKTRLKTTASTTFEDTAVTSGKTYYYYVEAYSSTLDVASAYSDVRSKYVPIVTLAAPEFTSLTSDGTSVILKWNSVATATSYRVYRSATNGGTKTHLATLAGTTYADTSVTAGNTYYYYVQAYSNTTGLLSNYSAVRSKYVPKPASLTAPQFTSLTSDGTSVVLKWNAISGATSYRVYRSATNGGTKTRLKTTSSTTYEDTAVTPGNTYYYYVEAYSSTLDVSSPYSDVRSKYVPKTESLAAPQFTSLTSDGTSVVLKWNSVSGATSYRVYRSTTNGGTKTRLKTTDSTTYEDTTVTQGKTYYYYVEAYSSTLDIASAYSNVRSKYVPVSLAAPTISSISSDGTCVVVSWGKIAGATGYNIYRSTTNGGTKTKLCQQTATTYLDTNVTSGKTYYYYITAYSGSTESEFSGVRSKYVPAD